MSSTYSAGSGECRLDSRRLECEPSLSASATSGVASESSQSTGPTFPATTTLELFHTSEGYQSSRAASHVSRSHLPGSEWAKRMTATSGLSCLRSSDASGPLGYLERMLLASSTWASTRCYLIWKPMATPAGRLIFRLSHKTPTTSAGGSGSLAATPTTKANQNAPSMQKWASCKRLTEMLPTPTARDYKDGTSVQNVPENGLLGRVFANATGSALTPGFTEWMMGYPPRMDRLRALGNAVVPQVVEQIGRAILAAEHT